MAVLALGQLRRRDSRMAIAVAAMVLGGLANAVYITMIGGDYMHGRLLLPAFFAIALPASISVRRSALPEIAVVGVAGVWVLTSVVAFRPPPPPASYVVAPISDWRAVSGARIRPLDSAFGLNGDQAAAAYSRAT